MNLQVATIPEIVSRGATYILFLCILLLECADVTKLVPFDHRRLAYRAAMELICILVLLRLEDSSFVRDMIDIEMYCLAIKLALLLAYFAYVPSYRWIQENLFDSVITGLFVLAVVRIGWVSKVDGQWCPGRWPAIGLHGWLKSPLPNKPAVGRDECILIGLAIITCAAFGLAFGGAPDMFSWLIGILAGGGILGVAIYAKPVSRALQILLMTSEERHAVIMQYEDVIISSNAALQALRKSEAQSKLRLVPTKRDASTNDDEPDDVGEGNRKGATDARDGDE